MKNYRKKPVTVQALQWTGENDDEVADFMSYPVFKNQEGHLGVRTLEGLVYTAPGSFIVRGHHHDVWPVREDIFLDTYEEVLVEKPGPVEFTVAEYLDQLPPGYRERALNQGNPRCLRAMSTGIHGAVYSFTVWYKTEEGVNFWRDVATHYVEGTPLPALP